jgi:hypothetical protein
VLWAGAAPWVLRGARARGAAADRHCRAGLGVDHVQPGQSVPAAHALAARRVVGAVLGAARPAFANAQVVTHALAVVRRSGQLPLANVQLAGRAAAELRQAPALAGGWRHACPGHLGVHAADFFCD